MTWDGLRSIRRHAQRPDLEVLGCQVLNAPAAPSRYAGRGDGEDEDEACRQTTAVELSDASFIMMSRQPPHLCF